VPGPGYPLLVVRAGDFRAGIPVKWVRETVRLRRLARVPDARPPCRGLLSLRGEIVTVLELAGIPELIRRGGRPALTDTTGVTTGAIRPTRIESVVVLRGGKDPLGLEVDGIEDIRDFAARPGEQQIAGIAESTPSTAPAPGRMWAGVVRDERGEIGVLDPEAVFEVAATLAEAASEPEALEVGDGG
jgi:chemotaxis signal transduction protein